MYLWMWLACQNEETLSSIPVTTPIIESVEQGGVPPMHQDSNTLNVLKDVQQNTNVLSLYKSCVVEDELGSLKWFFFAWNPEGTAGLVVGIHGVLPQQMPIEQTRKLDIATRDAFLMLEVGEKIPTNFCTSTVQQIPIATVLESRAGQVEIKRSGVGWSLGISEVVYQDQYSKSEWVMPEMTIPTQTVERP